MSGRSVIVDGWQREEHQQYRVRGCDGYDCLFHDCIAVTSQAYERNRERGYGSWKGNDQMVGVDGKPIAQSGGGGGASGGGASGGGSGSKRGRGAEEGSATPGKGGKRGRVSKE